MFHLYATKSTLVRVTLHITKYVCTFFSKRRPSVESETHFCPLTFLTTLILTGGQALSSLSRAHTGIWRTRNGSLLTLWCLGATLSQSIPILTFMAPQPWKWVGRKKVAGGVRMVGIQHFQSTERPCCHIFPFLQLLEDECSYYPSLWMRKLSPQTLCHLLKTSY